MSNILNRPEDQADQIVVPSHTVLPDGTVIATQTVVPNQPGSLASSVLPDQGTLNQTSSTLPPASSAVPQASSTLPNQGGILNPTSSVVPPTIDAHAPGTPAHEWTNASSGTAGTLGTSSLAGAPATTIPSSTAGISPISAQTGVAQPATLSQTGVSQPATLSQTGVSQPATLSQFGAATNPTVVPGVSTPGLDVPGAYPMDLDANATPAHVTAENAKKAGSGIVETARHYIPGLAETAKHYLPQSVAHYLPGSTDTTTQGTHSNVPATNTISHSHEVTLHPTEVGKQPSVPASAADVAEQAKQTSTGAAETAKQTLASATDTAIQVSAKAAETARQTLASAAETTKQATAGTGQTVSQTSGNAAESAKQTAASARDTTYQASANTAETVRQTSASAAETTKQTAANAAETTRQTAASAAETTRQTAASAAETVKQTTVNAAETAKQYLPASIGNYLPGAAPATTTANTQSTAQTVKDKVLPSQDTTNKVTETTKQYLPERAGNYLPDTTTKGTENMTLPSQETSAEHQISSGGVGALPGPISEEGVAKLPEERAQEGTLNSGHQRPVQTTSNTLSVSNPLPHSASNYSTSAQAGSTTSSFEARADNTPTPGIGGGSVGVGGHHGALGGVGDLPGSRHETGVAVLPEERNNNPFSGSDHGHSGVAGGVGHLPGDRNESGVAQLPDEKNSASQYGFVYPGSTAPTSHGHTSATGTTGTGKEGHLSSLLPEKNTTATHTGDMKRNVNDYGDTDRTHNPIVGGTRTDKAHEMKERVKDIVPGSGPVHDHHSATAKGERYERTGLGGKDGPPAGYDGYGQGYHPAELHPMTGAPAHNDSTSAQTGHSVTSDASTRSLPGSKADTVTHDTHDYHVNAATEHLSTADAVQGHRRTGSTGSTGHHKTSLMSKLKGEAKVIAGKVTRKDEKVEEGRRLMGKE